MVRRDFTGRVAFISGAAQGIGFAIAEELARRGALLALNDLNSQRLTSAVTSLQATGATCVPIVGDVTRPEVVADAVEQVIANLGQLNILVNCAGVLRPTKCENINDEEWDLVVNANLKSTFLCCRASISALRRYGTGSIVNISSSAGKSVSTVGGCHYTAAKAGVLGLTRHLARELASDGIRVNAVCPGLIATEMVHSTITENQTQAYAAGFPLKRLGEPAEVAKLVAFLASDEASYITGASYDINGGDLTI